MHARTHTHTCTHARTHARTHTHTHTHTQYVPSHWVCTVVHETVDCYLWDCRLLSDTEIRVTSTWYTAMVCWQEAKWRSIFNVLYYHQRPYGRLTSLMFVIGWWYIIGELYSQCIHVSSNACSVLTGVVYRGSIFYLILGLLLVPTPVVVIKTLVCLGYFVILIVVLFMMFNHGIIELI